jgi:hypothetical protein
LVELLIHVCSHSVDLSLLDHFINSIGKRVSSHGFEILQERNVFPEFETGLKTHATGWRLS